MNRAALTVAANDDSKTYNGLAYSGGNGVSYTGLVNGESNAVLGGTLGYSGTSQGAVNAGSYVITPGGLTSSNYAISFVNGALTVNRAALMVSLTGTVEKTYDGNTNATLAASNYSLAGIVGSDDVTLNSPTAGRYDTPDVGTGKTVTVPGLALTGAASGNYKLSSTSAAGTVGIIDSLGSQPGNRYSDSQYQTNQPSNGNTTPVNINFQQNQTNTTPPVTTVTTPGNQNIAPGSGPELLFPPISQFDRNQYTNDTLPDFAPQAGEAAVLTMIARAEKNNRQSPKIDALWHDGAADWPNTDTVLKNVSFSDGNGQMRTPAGDNGFAVTNGTTDIAALLQNGPVMLGGAKPADPAAPTPWLLAIKMTDDGKGIIANDPLTGDQVVLAYDPATKMVGGVTAVIDPTSGKPVPLGTGAPTLTGQKTEVSGRVWTELKAFKPANYFAVSI